MENERLVAWTKYVGLVVAITGQAAIIAVHEYPQLDTPGTLLWAIGTYAGLAALGLVTVGTLAYTWTQGRWPVPTRVGWSVAMVVAGAADVWVAVQAGELTWVLYIAGLVHLFCVYGLLFVEDDQPAPDESSS